MTITDHRTRNSLAWTERAACRGAPPDLFFPVSHMGPAEEQIDEAKRICARCPVRAECLRHALRSGEASGIWGGTTEHERRRMRRRARRTARAAT